MSRQIVISLVGAAIGVGLLGMSSASAAPISGAVIGKAASADELTQKVLWRGRGVGWRGYGWRRGVGVGLVGAGVATAAAYGAYSAYNHGYDNNNGYDNYAADTSGYGDNYGYGNNYGYPARPGWRVASAAQNYNYGSPNYNYGYASNYNSRNYNSGNWDGRGTYARPGVAAATTSYGYGNNSGYASNRNAGSYGYRNNYGSGYYGQGGVASAVASRPNNYGYGNNSGYASNYNAGNSYSQTTYSQPSAAATTYTAPAPGRWTAAYCINAVRERFGISSTDAGKSTNAWAVKRCMEGGPMRIG